eukprot:gene2936-1918_t
MVYPRRINATVQQTSTTAPVVNPPPFKVNSLPATHQVSKVPPIQQYLPYASTTVPSNILTNYQKTSPAHTPQQATPRNHPHDQQLPPSYTYIKTRLKHNSTQIKPTLHLKHAIFPKAHHSLTSSSTKNHPAQQARNYPHTKKPHPYQQPEQPQMTLY